MYCPNCGSELNKDDFCNGCGQDVAAFKKTAFLSNSYYNKGLEQAGVNDFSGAVQSLNRSIAFNKNNTDARNLLGLVYFEVGHIGDALRHWVISNNFNTDNNLAKEYIDYSQKNVRLFEKLNESIKMYNKALVYLKQKSDDMAVIQLRRAIDINPKFIDAYNLLILCYIIQKEDDKALLLISKVLEMDVGNTTALNYFKHLKPNGGNPPKPDTTQRKQSRKESSVSYGPGMSPNRKVVSGGIRWFEILSFIAGGLCAAAVMYILYIPAEIDAREQKIKNMENSLSKLEQHYQDRKAEDEEKIKGLEADNKKLEEEQIELQSQVEINSKVQKINTASNLYAQGKNEEAAAALLGMDLTNVPPESIDNYNSLVEKAFPKAAQSLYTAGKSQYDKKTYDEAKKLLEQALAYADSVPVTKYNAMYYLGMICVSDGDAVKAKDYFEQVEQNHTNASMRSYARTQLRNLENR